MTTGEIYQQAREALEIALAALPVLSDIQGFTPFQQLLVARVLEYELTRLEEGEAVDPEIDEWITEFAAECQPAGMSGQK